MEGKICCTIFVETTLKMAVQKKIKVLQSVKIEGDMIKAVSMLSNGKTIWEISKALEINTRRTLEGRILAIKTKFEIATLPQLVAFFFRNKLIK